MNEPTNNARETLGAWIVRLEVALMFAGTMVVVGLLIEEWRELSAAYHEQRWPNRETTGNILVTFGVLLEVVIAAIIARLSRKSEQIADWEIAELANSRAIDAAAEPERSVRKWVFLRNNGRLFPACGT
jgi:hypothetical protein